MLRRVKGADNNLTVGGRNSVLTVVRSRCHRNAEIPTGLYLLRKIPKKSFQHRFTQFRSIKVDAPAQYEKWLFLNPSYRDAVAAKNLWDLAVSERM